MFDLFKELYVDSSVKLHTYRRIFCAQYNYSFHRPKKDTCITCEKYNNANNKEDLQEMYDQHQRNKILARESKSKDKEVAKLNKALKVFTFDMQSVLSSPCLNVSCLYYARKFSTYNSTFYDMENGEGYCFVWNESQGNRGSDEVGTTIYKLLSMQKPSVTDIIFYSDCCGGQNRNRFIASLLIYMNNNLKFNSITLKFLESGHTQMEADSIHSTIEKCKRDATIYSPEEWPTLIRQARRKQPYNVTTLQFSDILDLKTLLNDLGHTLKKNTKNEQVNWLKIKALMVNKSTPIQLHYKENWVDDYKVINPIQGRQKSKLDINKLSLGQKYKRELPVSKAKLNDLQGLCKNNIIPSDYQSFYYNLSSEDKKDRLAEPDAEEEEDDNE